MRRTANRWTSLRAVWCLALLLAQTSVLRADCIAPEVTVNRVGGIVWLREGLDGPFIKAEGCRVILEDPDTDKQLAELTTDATGRFRFEVAGRRYVRLVFEHVGVIRQPVYLHIRPQQVGEPTRSVRVELYPGAHECGGWARLALGP